MASPKPSNPYLSVNFAKCPVMLPPLMANIALSNVHDDAASVLIAFNRGYKRLNFKQFGSSKI